MFILYFTCLTVFYCKSLKKLIDEIIKIIQAKNKKNDVNKNYIKNNKIDKIYSRKNKNKNNKRSKKIKIEKKLMEYDSTFKKLDKDSNITIMKNKIKNKIAKDAKLNENNYKEHKYILECTDSEMNSLPYEKALMIDKRTYFQYYFSLLKKKQIILFSFYPNKDYNAQIIKSFLFFFFYTSDMTINALFFTDDTMHKIYIDSGKFNLIYQLPQIIYSYNNKNIIKRSKNKKKDKKLMKFDSIYKKLDKDSDITMIKNNIKNKNINKKDNNILEYTDSELNSLAFGEALIKDKRSYCQYYWSLLKKKQSILFSFYPNKDYNSQVIKSFLFFFFYSSDMTINALFFTDDTMHKIYIDSGSFNFIYQIPQIIYSFLISNIINFIIEFFSLSEDTIISIKTKNLNLKQRNKIISYMKTKFCIFFIITFILLLIFSFYISCFCCIYENTQMHLIKDSLLSFGVSLLYPVFTNLIPGIFRIAALNNQKGGSLCMYKLSQVIEFLNL